MDNNNIENIEICKYDSWQAMFRALFLNHIRFPIMDNHYFTSKIKELNLLTNEEMLQITFQMLDKNNNSQIKSKFDDKKRKKFNNCNNNSEWPSCGNGSNNGNKNNSWTYGSSGFEFENANNIFNNENLFVPNKFRVPCLKYDLNMSSQHNDPPNNYYSLMTI